MFSRSARNSAVLLASVAPRLPLPRGAFSLPICRSFSSAEHTLHNKAKSATMATSASSADDMARDVDWYDTRMSSDEGVYGGGNRKRLRFAKRSQSAYEPQFPRTRVAHAMGPANFQQPPRTTSERQGATLLGPFIIVASIAATVTLLAVSNNRRRNERAGPRRFTTLYPVKARAT